jgi:hypothetical protein
VQEEVERRKQQMMRRLEEETAARDQRGESCAGLRALGSVMKREWAEGRQAMQGTRWGCRSSVVDVDFVVVVVVVVVGVVVGVVGVVVVVVVVALMCYFDHCLSSHYRSLTSRSQCARSGRQRGDEASAGEVHERDGHRHAVHQTGYVELFIFCIVSY